MLRQGVQKAANDQGSWAIISVNWVEELSVAQIRLQLILTKVR